jgi:N,N'-diacetyllegionaminate synthase
MRKIEIIAEIGQNHNGDMRLAKKMIWAAKKAGCDVAKFQLYEAVKVFKKTPGYEWYDYNLKTEISRKNLIELKKECDKAKIEFMASVFDEERVGWLEKLKVKRYKVASRSVTENKLIKKVYSTGKPVIMALGMWKGKNFPKTPNNKRTSFLYCVSKYPTELKDLHFDKVNFNKYAGFSDHTVGISAPITAMVRGAKIIEKHFTLDKKMYGPDHIGSATPEEFKMMSEFRNDLEKMI